MLGIQRHDARVPGAVELDALARLPGRCNRLRSLLYGRRAGCIAVLQKSGNRVVHHLDHDIAGLVIAVHTAMDEGHAFADAARELELEVRQAVIAHAATKAHHRGFADMRPHRQLSHRQMREGPRIGQYQACNTLLCRRQGRKGGSNPIKHIGADEVEAMNECRKRRA
ncbi:hypothetical protein SDC9_175550 [bioreactor metagenome]|uniref:Uncharacterized protein n=1 Tax=bioreactor metagenome TaxID=1076179 RepID=A0A645GME4_9ZZZZ